MGLARPAAADPISFDYNGGAAGGAATVNSFDWWPGNSILLEDAGTILYQANLNVGSFPDQQTACTLANFDCITAVASFSVVPTIIPGQFSVVSGTFSMYAGATYADDLTGGSAFADETLILTSTIVFPFGTTSFTADLITLPDGSIVPNIELLDQFNGDSHSGQLSVTGSGGIANILTTVTFANPAYFLDLGAGSILNTTLSAGSNNLPFTQVDPTNLFFNGVIGVPQVASL
jgi:hypothetical protein